MDSHRRSIIGEAVALRGIHRSNPAAGPSRAHRAGAEAASTVDAYLLSSTFDNATNRSARAAVFVPEYCFAMDCADCTFPGSNGFVLATFDTKIPNALSASRSFERSLAKRRACCAETFVARS